jgi:hypothetical protein
MSNFAAENSLFRGKRGGETSYYMQNVMEAARIPWRKARKWQDRPNPVRGGCWEEALCRVIADAVDAFDWGDDAAWANQKSCDQRRVFAGIRARRRRAALRP